ncbi:cyclin-dependent kinase regulatory subunit 1 [Nannochloropsis oceanica]
MASRIEYSEKYMDDKHEYRHVILPKELARSLPKQRLLTETEWRGIGVQQSRGWQHYAIHRPEPHILLFRRPLGTDPVTGKVVAELEREAKEAYAKTMNGAVQRK